MTFAESMDKLAAIIVRKAEFPDTPLAESIDAFKALTPYFAILVKSRKADADGEASFADFTKELTEHQNGGTELPDRRRGYPLTIDN